MVDSTFGQSSFSGIRLLTAPGRVMTPRRATEHLVEQGVARLGRAPAKVADVGSGSGAIAIAIALRAPNVEVWATDRSEAAVELTRANVARYGLGQRVRVVRGDLLESGPGLLDLVVANLPYLPEKVRLESKYADLRRRAGGCCLRAGRRPRAIPPSSRGERASTQTGGRALHPVSRPRPRGDLAATSTTC
jgi:HemK-like putative methylase